jgi:hypothetical protein
MHDRLEGLWSRGLHVTPTLSQGWKARARQSSSLADQGLDMEMSSGMLQTYDTTLTCIACILADRLAL